MPVIDLIILVSWRQVLPVSCNELFVYGGFNSINMVTLYFLGTNYKSNSASFLFAAGVFSYMYFPHILSYNTSNYLAANLWVVGMKYIVDKDRRN